jgi:hypothetical protein
LTPSDPCDSLNWISLGWVGISIELPHNFYIDVPFRLCQESPTPSFDFQTNTSILPWYRQSYHLLWRSYTSFHDQCT